MCSTCLVAATTTKRMIRAGADDWFAPPQLGESPAAQLYIHDDREATAFVLRLSMPKFASQSRSAFSSMAWNTGPSSPGELELMTLKTSDVAVCCSSDSVRSVVRCRNSLSSRVFSMAMTAWAAKFCQQFDLLVGERAELPGGR